MLSPCHDINPKPAVPARNYPESCLLHLGIRHRLSSRLTQPGSLTGDTRKGDSHRCSACGDKSCDSVDVVVSVRISQDPTSEARVSCDQGHIYIFHCGYILHIYIHTGIQSI